MRVKSELKNLKPTDLNLPVGTKLYINESLCSYYSGLWNQCKKLWNWRKLFSFFTGNDSVRVKLQENGSYNITQIDDLKYFLKKISQYFSSVCFVFIVSYFRERASWEILCKICVSTVWANSLSKKKLEKLSNSCWMQNLKSIFCFIFK